MKNSLDLIGKLYQNKKSSDFEYIHVRLLIVYTYGYITVAVSIRHDSGWRGGWRDAQGTHRSLDDHATVDV